MATGYALIVDGDDSAANLDGAIAELSASDGEPGVLRAEIRIFAHQDQENG